MLNRQKLIGQLDQVSKDLFLKFAKEQDIARTVWELVKNDTSLCSKIHAKKHSFLLPKWNGILGDKKAVGKSLSDYSVLAVDGSQIYYDKHQGPACYLLNIGSVLLHYSSIKSSVYLSSEPHVFVLSDEDVTSSSAEFVNLQREEYEFAKAWQLSLEQVEKKESHNKFEPNKFESNRFVTLFDGSLIFFHLDGQEQEQKQKFLQRYLDYLYKFYEQRILIAGYMSFPRCKELVNILKLVLVQFDETELKNSMVLDQLTDMDIVRYFLNPGERSIVFESKAPISYLYPKEIKPYFCYLHVGFEIVRLEFPAWIAQQEELVDQLCQIAFDQADKGKGYPVCLFEAHEQAVVKSVDREFFYTMMQRMSQKHAVVQYQRSFKSIKKLQVPV